MVEGGLGLGDEALAPARRRAPARVMAPTPWPAGKNSRSGSTPSVSSSPPRWLAPSCIDSHDCAGKRLELVGVVLEVLGVLVAHDAARLAGVGPADDRAVLARCAAARPCSRRRPRASGVAMKRVPDPHAVGAEGSARRRAPARRRCPRRRPPAPGRRRRRRPAARGPSWRPGRCGRRPRCPGRRRCRSRPRRRRWRGGPCRTCSPPARCGRGTGRSTSRGTPSPATNTLRPAVDDLA